MERNNILRPIIPIDDLLPAVSIQIQEESKELDELRKICVKESDNSWSTRTPLRMNLRTYIQALLKHSISLDFLEIVRNSNGNFSTGAFFYLAISDWVYLCALNDIEHKISTRITSIINKEKWNKDFLNGLHSFISINLQCTDDECKHSVCQVGFAKS